MPGTFSPSNLGSVSTSLDPNIIIRDMGTNIILKFDIDTKFIYAKITPKKLISDTGYLYINGTRFQVTTAEFTKIWPI